jgi:hypothetical protein
MFVVSRTVAHSCSPEFEHFPRGAERIAAELSKPMLGANPRPPSS